MHASKPLCILSDSASVLTALESQTSRHPWIQRIQMEAPPDTTFLWIPGHCDIRGNCEADHLAASGRSGRLATKTVPGPDIKVWVKSILRNAWAQEWATKREPFLRKIKGDTTKWLDSPKRQTQMVMSRLRTGHTKISHNFSGNGPFRKSCELCHTLNSVEHVICHCPQYEGLRELYGIPGSIRDALSDDPVRTTAMMGFLREAGILHQI